MSAGPEDSLRGCFLCQPDDRLVFMRRRVGVALAGLGPIVPGYSVVGTSEHVEALEELPIKTRLGFLEFAEKVRVVLATEYGTCLMTEHGNSPLCEFDISRDKHCFHPHFLLFPGAPNVCNSVPADLGRSMTFTALDAAVNSVSSSREYLLLSPIPGEYRVILPDGMLPSQFARKLVATELGLPELASWRAVPSYARALENAVTNRRVIQRLRNI